MILSVGEAINTCFLFWFKSNLTLCLRCLSLRNFLLSSSTSSTSGLSLFCFRRLRLIPKLPLSVVELGIFSCGFTIVVRRCVMVNLQAPFILLLFLWRFHRLLRFQLRLLLWWVCHAIIVVVAGAYNIHWLISLARTFIAFFTLTAILGQANPPRP